MILKYVKMLPGRYGRIKYINETIAVFREEEEYDYSTEDQR